MLKDFAKKFKAWIKEGHYIWVFFNNDIHAYALSNAKNAYGDDEINTGTESLMTT